MEKQKLHEEISMFYKVLSSIPRFDKANPFTVNYLFPIENIKM